MLYDVEVVLRDGTDATVERIEHAREPRDWTETDVRDVLTATLLAINRARDPDAPAPPVVLRGFSWIVEPFDDGRVVVALEIPMGAAVAGPFAIAPATLDALIRRALASPAGHGPAVH